MKLTKIAKYTGGKLHGKDAIINALEIDSRKSVPNSMFIAIKGDRVDGHSFLDKAVENGAVAVMVEDVQAHAIPQIQVENCVKALGKIASHYRKNYQGVIIGITGSCGKTSTKEMLVAILSEKGDVLATKGNQNNEIGVPLTVLNLDNKAPYAVIEMGAAQQGDIAYLMEIVEPDITVITNVGTAHIGRFGSEKIIAETKSEIYSKLKASGNAVINLDDKYSQKWIDMINGHEYLTYSLENTSADIFASNIISHTDGSEFTLNYKLANVRILLHVPGLHNIYNALCASACAMRQGVTLEQVAQGLRNFMPVNSRLQKLVGFWGGALIDDCYNANPASVKAAIDVLKQYPGKQIFVLGDMGELGDRSEAAHKEIGEYAKSQNIKIFLTCGVLSKFASDVFGIDARNFIDKVSLTEYLKKIVGKDDVVLVKGSRSAAMEDIVTALRMSASNENDVIEASH